MSDKHAALAHLDDMFWAHITLIKAIITVVSEIVCALHKCQKEVYHIVSGLLAVFQSLVLLLLSIGRWTKPPPLCGILSEQKNTVLNTLTQGKSKWFYLW